MYDNYETLKVTRQGRVVTVALNRPEVMNATSPLMHQELIRIFPEIDRDPEIDIVILTGEGKAFAAGGDLAGMKKNLTNHARWLESMDEARALVYGPVDIEKPVIAKVNGHAIGMGATLALFCDIIIANEKARFADPHVNVGLVCGDGGSVIWPTLIGYPRAKKFLFTGEAITGREAAEIGLITEAVPLEQLDQRVDALAQALLKQPQVALRLTKKSVNTGLRQIIDSQLEAHLGYETMSHLTADHAEAVHAFVEGRKPNFTGK